MSTSDSFEDVAAGFKARLTDEEQRKFQICTLQDLQAEVVSIQKRQDAKREMKNLRRIESFLEAVQQFGAVIDLYANANVMVAFIWGPMKLILHVASSWTYAFDQILEGYEKLGESFPILEQYIDLFGKHPELKRVLQLLYKDILEFHIRALRFFTRPAWRQVFRALWIDFKVKFQNILDNLDRHRRLLQDQAQALQMLSTRENFKDIKNALVNLQKEQSDAKLRMDQDEQQRHADEQQRVLTWIAGSIATARDHHDDTFGSRFQDGHTDSWILQHKTIKDWLSDELKTSLVWISGMPGAGKTVLASLIIEHCTSDLKAHTAYFYCKHDDPDTLTTTGILKAVLMQQLCWRSDLTPYFAERKQNSGEPVLGSEKLAKDLFALACKGSERQYIIIDGIDECLPDQRANILNCLITAVNGCDADQPGKLRVLVVSQNEKDIRRLLGSATELCLSDPQNSQSHQKVIRNYVESRARDVRLKFELNEAACEEVDTSMDAIEDRMRLITLEAAGQFLYAKLVMENLYDQNSQQDFFEEIGRDRLPKGLAEAYERIIVRLRRKETCWRDARLLLGWMTCAIRPLKWHEIQGMKSIDHDNEEVNFQRHKFRADAVEICGSLIAIHGDRVGFMHSTASKFIAESTYIDLPVVQCQLTASCLQYLSFQCFEPLPDDDTDKKIPSEQQDHIEYVNNGYFAFADYAVSTWTQHLMNVCNATQALLEPSRWSGDEGREVAVQEVAEAAEVFVSVHLHDQLNRDDEGQSILSDNTCASAARRLFKDIMDDGYHVQLLVRHITKANSNPEGYKKISLPSLEKSFMRMRDTIESLTSNSSTSREAVSELQQFYGDKLFKCRRPKCVFFHEGFTDKRTRDHHQRLHDRPYQCDVPTCTSNDFAFANKADLKRHVEEFHPDAEIKARLFKIPEVVDEKTSKHKHPCIKCNKFFLRKNILDDHMLAHAGQKPHECRVCGKAFTRKSDRWRHEKIHEKRVRR